MVERGMNNKSLSLREFHALCPDEEAARLWFECSRWPAGAVCHHCGSVKMATFMPTRSIWQCRACGCQFTVKAGTPMHKSHLPLLTWAEAIYLIVASSKGVSAKKLGEMVGVGYATAWFLAHRIRAMMAENDPLLSGIVEIDEKYAGGAPRKRAKGGDDDPPDNHISLGPEGLRARWESVAPEEAKRRAQVLESPEGVPVAHAEWAKRKPEEYRAWEEQQVARSRSRNHGMSM